MATPLYDALVAKVRDFSNKPETNTIPNSVIQDCLKYAADECYRELRIPPLEATALYTVDASDNEGENSVGLPYGNAYTTIQIPDDAIRFIYLRTVAESNLTNPYSTYPSNISKVFHEITDARTFFDAYSEKYSVYNWMWKGDKIFIHPQLKVGATLEIQYYRRLPALDATYDVVSYNYLIALSDADQPYLSLGTSEDTPLYFVGGVVYDTEAEALTHGTVTTKYYTGKEVDNWLRDQNERLLLWGALMHLGGSYLFDDKMEARHKMKFTELVDSLNKEEKWRRASGGNVQININTGGLI